eukprot:131167-Amphidinium_carterae.1
MNPDWPSINRQRQYAVAFKVIPRSEAALSYYKQFMFEPAWEELHKALVFSPSWLSKEVNESYDRLQGLLTDGSYGLQADVNVMELTMPHIVLALESPGTLIHDWWAAQYFKVTTMFLLRLVRLWHDVEEYEKAREAQKLSLITGWAGDFTLADHRGWLQGFGHWDAAAIISREVWPPGTQPKTGAPALELLDLLRSGASQAQIPPPQPAISWWAAPRTFEPLTLRSQVQSLLGARSSGAAVIIIEEHHIDYMELRALVER